MTDERELERHNRVLEQIQNAKTIDDLPKVGYSTVSSYLASNVYFNNEKLSQTLFQPVINAIVDYGSVAHKEVKDALIKVIVENYPDVSEDEIVTKYKSVLGSKRIGYILSEISQKNLKTDEILRSINLENHSQIIKDINSTFDIKNLPKVGLSELNRRLVRAVNDNDFVTNIKTSEIKELTDSYLSGSSYSEKEDIIDKVVSNYDLSDEDKILMKEQILGALFIDETIEYIVEEIKLKEERKTFIYKNDHEITMDAIKEANRISQLPPCLTISTINSYLNGNTTIYTNDDRINAEDLKGLTDLLYNDHKWDEDVVKEEVKRIALLKYPEKDDAYDLLYNKLSILPRTYYLVEEVKYSQERQVEFIGRGSSNVNVYFIPNDKSPIDGGRFYNCYINRVGNLDLSQILPLDLDSIVPPDMDIDSVEWYVQDRYDPTFKKAGGIILNRDETIGNISVFKPNDGTVGVSPESKAKMDSIDSLDVQIEEKKKALEILNSEVEAKEKQSHDVENRLKNILTSYEKKALELQKELMENICSLKDDLGIDQVQEETKEKGL